MPEQQFISVCGFCQKEFPKASAKIKETSKRYGINGEIVFSHGYCYRHYVVMMKGAGFNDEYIKQSLAGVNVEEVPDLKKHPELVKLWEKGLFTKEQIAQAQSQQSAINENFKSRLQMLAGINK